MAAPDIGNLEGIRLPDLFTISHSGGSGFDMSRIWHCPREAAYTLLGWRQKWKSFPLVFGSIAHSEAFKCYLDDDGEVSPARAAAAVQDVVDTEKYQDTFTAPDGKRIEYTQEIEVKGGDRVDGPRIMQAIMEVWDERKYPKDKVLACERLAVTKLLHPETGNEPPEAEGFQVSGRLDLAIRETGADGEEHPAIRDLKTSKKALDSHWVNDIGYTMQLSLYSYIWAALRGSTVSSVGLFQLVKNKTKKGVEKHAGELLLDQWFGWDRVYNALISTIEQLKFHVKQGRWPMCHPKHCNGMFGQTCWAAPLCYAQEMGEDAWKETLYRKEEFVG